MSSDKGGSSKRPHGGDSEDESPLESKKQKRDYAVLIEFKVKLIHLRLRNGFTL